MTFMQRVKNFLRPTTQRADAEREFDAVERRLETAEQTAREAADEVAIARAKSRNWKRRYL